MSITVDAERVDFSNGVRRRIMENVATEAPVNIYVNDDYLITLLATPRLQKQLAIGWLFDERVLLSWDNVKEVIQHQNNVRVTTKRPLGEKRWKVVGMTRILTTSGGLSSNQFLKGIQQKGRKVVKSDYKVEARDITRMVQKLNDISELFKSTGGTHSAALFEGGELAASAEDIGRHNAIDKTIGIGVQSNLDFYKCILVSSGRQPANMVLKAANMGIPIVASKASPIHSGIIAAENTGVTLIGFVRYQRMNIYTHPNRILT